MNGCMVFVNKMLNADHVLCLGTYNATHKQNANVSYLKYGKQIEFQQLFEDSF